jgi:uncharacterized lipoprotein YddW (UPF0748 family)
MKKYCLITVLILLTVVQLNAQNKREFRGVWIASVSNLDWPKSADRGFPDKQKADLQTILDKMVDLNLNVAIFQVRTECDALYNSAYEPWSRFLVNPQGTNPGYDPLKFAIEEAHKRGIELHAWLNPYRINVSASDGGDYYHSTHVYKENPEWAISYSDNKKILNPGLPQVTKYIKQVVGDILGKYDVDGIHFDDYFYAYGGTPNQLDQATFDQYGQGFTSRGDFRRASINYMVSEVFDTIQKTKPYVRFGISPFGIYGNSMNPPGITGLDAYNTIYSDPLAWLNAGTVDYLNPQLYWPTGGAQDYETLLPWWSQHAHSKNRHLYSGNGTYRLSANPVVKKAGILKRFFKSIGELFSNTKSTSDPVAAWTLGQIKLQVDINRNHNHINALGSNFFRYNDFNRVNGLANYTKSDIFITKAIVPEMGWKTAPSLATPTNLRMEYNAEDLCNYLIWDYPAGNTRFVVYIDDLSAGNVNIANPEKIYAIVYDKKLKLTQNFPIPQGMVVTALDRNGFESSPSTVYGILPPEKPDLVLPANQATVPLSFSFQWENLSNTGSYRLQVSTTAEFTEPIVNTSGITGNSHPASTYNLNGKQTYYWRVAGVNPGGQGEFSDPFSFTTGYPSTPVITYPENNSFGVDLKPAITWTGAISTDSILIQISEGGTVFDQAKLVINEMAKGVNGTYTISKSLKEYTNYFLRAKAYNTFGEGNYSSTIQFRTLMRPPSTKPTITSPLNNATDVAMPVTITWTSAKGASGYLLQLADNADFTTEIVQVETSSDTSYTFPVLAGSKKYFSRVSGKNEGGTGEWSSAINFTTSVATMSDDISFVKKQLFCYPNPVENNMLTIEFNVEKSGVVLITILNSKGQVVKEVISQHARVGRYSITAELNGLAPDIYFVVLKKETEEIFKIIKNQF